MSEQIYQKTGFLLPLSDGQQKFLKIYFIGDDTDELKALCKVSIALEDLNIFFMKCVI